MRSNSFPERHVVDVRSATAGLSRTQARHKLGRVCSAATSENGIEETSRTLDMRPECIILI